MEYPIVARVIGARPTRARLTTNHATSSYGLPVVVLDQDPRVAYGLGEVLWLDGSPEALAAAAKDGYSVLPPEWSRWPEGYDALEE